MATRLEMYGTDYLELGGPDGPTHFVRLGDERITPRAAGDLIIDPNVAAIDWDTGWLYPTFLNGWRNYNVSTHVVARYRKAAGVVTVEGLIAGGTMSAAAFELPVGYRSVNRIIVPTLAVDNSLPKRLDLLNGYGHVVPITGTNTWVSVQMTFFADA